MVSFTYSGMFSNNNSRIPVDVQHLIIDESVSLLPDEVCRQRQQLLQIVFPSSLFHIGERSFDRCTALPQVTFPSGLRSIGEYAFHQCTSLVEVSSLPEGLEKIGMQAFSKCGALKRINVPSTVKKIENSAFSKCILLEEVILVEGLISIGDYAFFECYLLREIKLPETVETIGSSAFSRCKSLFDIGLPSSRYQLLSYAFSDCSSLEEVEIPSWIDSIPDGVFTGCSSLIDVRLHEGLKRIGANSFAEASSLVKLKLPSTTTSISFGAFAGCASLAQVDLSEEGLIEIGSHSFLECAALSRFRVPSTVGRIDQFAFSGCINLVSVEFSPTRQVPLRIGDSAFRNCKSLINVAISSESSGERIDIHANALDGCDWLRETFGDDSDPPRAFSDRFDKFPLHRKCYHSRDTTLNELRQELESFPIEDGNDREELIRLFDCDKFAMTPFHVLLSAACCRLDLLELLLQTYPSFVLDWKDVSGKRAIDYLGPILNEDSKALMQSYLQKWLIDRLVGWGMNEWRSDLANRVRDIIAEEDRVRRGSFLTDAYYTLKRYERVETMALLELALWKNDMVSSYANGAPLSADVSDREGHRAKCGTTFVVPNVIAFLEHAVLEG